MGVESRFLLTLNFIKKIMEIKDSKITCSILWWLW